MTETEAISTIQVKTPTNVYDIHLGHDLLGLIAKHDGGRDKVYRDLAAHLAATEAAPEPVHEAAADDGQTAGASPATNSPAGK